MAPVVRARGHLRLVHGTTTGTGTVRPGSRVEAGEPALRLTRRGRAVLRLLIVVVLVALMAATALVLARSAQAEADPAAPVAYHVVLPGETLWGIATELTHGQDPRDAVALIVEVNHLPSSGVQAGQRLVLPPGLTTGR